MFYVAIGVGIFLLPWRSACLLYFRGKNLERMPSAGLLKRRPNYATDSGRQSGFLLLIAVANELPSVTCPS